MISIVWRPFVICIHVISIGWILLIYWDNVMNDSLNESLHHSMKYNMNLNNVLKSGGSYLGSIPSSTISNY